MNCYSSNILFIVLETACSNNYCSLANRLPLVYDKRTRVLKILKTIYIRWRNAILTSKCNKALNIHVIAEPVKIICVYRPEAILKLNIK